MPTVIPNSYTDYARRIAATLGTIRPNEISTTSDQRRVFLGNYLLAPVVHTGVLSEAAMLALSTSSPRSCFAFDVAIRSDTDSAWICLGGRGTSIDQWFELAGPGTDGIDTIFGGYFSEGEHADDFTGGDYTGGAETETVYGGFFTDGIHGGFF